jgi:hypothetical protein
MSSRVTLELGLRQIPESAALPSSCHRQLEVPGFCMFATPRLHRIMISELHTFANPRLRGFQASENRELPVPEKHASRTLSNPDVSRVTGFPEFPNMGEPVCVVGLTTKARFPLGTDFAESLLLAKPTRQYPAVLWPHGTRLP